MKWMLLSQKKLDAIVQTQVAEAIAKENAAFEKEMLLKQANLQTLQSQINPHFLYNTLECIRGMALMENQVGISDIAWSLSRFFRYSISGKSNLVTLGDELENCEIYARIQKYRFHDRFTLEISGEQEVKTMILPKLSLQPIVENAMLHGLQDTLVGGRIQIRIERVHSDVNITISDNGCGMPPEQLAALNARIHSECSPREEGSHNGIAMYNVDRRMKLYFGSEYGLHVFSCQGMGTDVVLRLPYRMGAKE